ncbi:antibiotic resistance transport protein [Staphylococcus schleiferi]|uniref:Antibiotic resistance transport protein n=1 Tax=Staphylococcus schleiferi TaxID=1295 RepID=A0A7Z7QRF8_STASC|nr:antibiotic resistance transport protein [Staphylococcus schleiferi]SUM90405.1 antibiotic resistance transport protein [Staphylococcus schleiferi]
MKGALAWPFLRLYILALFFFSANAILNVMIPLRGHDLGATNATIGIVMGAYMLTAMLFRPWAGQVIAKIGPIKILRWILVINGFALILYGFTGLEGYFVARVMQGVCTAFFSMSLQIGIIDALPEEDRAQGISLYSLFSYIPGIIGPIIAVGIWNLDNLSYFALAMIIIAVTTGVVGFSATLNQDHEPQAEQPEKPPYGPVTVFLQLFKNPFLFKSGMIMLIASIGFGAVFYVYCIVCEYISSWTCQCLFSNSSDYSRIFEILFKKVYSFRREMACWIYAKSTRIAHDCFILDCNGTLSRCTHSLCECNHDRYYTSHGLSNAHVFLEFQITETRA